MYNAVPRWFTRDEKDSLRLPKRRCCGVGIIPLHNTELRPWKFSEYFTSLVYKIDEGSILGLRSRGGDIEMEQK